jgi:hypothetical protein
MTATTAGAVMRYSARRNNAHSHQGTSIVTLYPTNILHHHESRAVPLPGLPRACEGSCGATGEGSGYPQVPGRCIK